ncbi:MAG: hypothetical protein KDF59_11910 [Nitrosomonas sp.]|nr:hypothetical protein [Nitrosomonas sp.]
MGIISEIFKRFQSGCCIVAFTVFTLVIPSGIYAAQSCEQYIESVDSCAYELPGNVIEKLQIDAGFGWGIFSGTIYNGNDKYTITQLKVSMEPIHDHHHMEMMGDMHTMSHEPKVHKINMNLHPLAKSSISMALPDEDLHIHDFNWEVLKAFGYEQR